MTERQTERQAESGWLPARSTLVTDRAGAPDPAAPSVATAATVASAAMSALHRGLRAVAVDRLIDAERAIQAGPVSWDVRHALAECYRIMRMYELAVPHLEVAPPTHRHHGAELHLIWADELEQVEPVEQGEPGDGRGGPVGDGDDRGGQAIAEHRLAAWTELGETLRTPENQAVLDALAHECRLAADPALVDVLADPELGPASAGVPLTVRIRGQVARCRALLLLGRPPEAVEHGRRGVELAGRTPKDPVAMRSALHALHRAEVAMGLDGALVAERLLSATARSLWQERSDAMQAARLRRDAVVLEQRRAEAERLATIDPLTSLANRGALESWLARHPVGQMRVAMVDLTDFKSVNDRFGHVVGDQVLARVARCLETALPGRLVCRFGGDEFVVVDDRDVGDAPDAGGEAIEEIIRGALAGVHVGDLVGGPLAGCEIGWAECRVGEDARGLLDQADRRLLAAKRSRS